MTDCFASRLLRWYAQHGRHDLPWQQPRSLYRCWVSEIMLQQTQVATVIPYFDNFMRAFPDIGSLARASQDEVMRHWAGLGYYSRARNLHRAAQMIVERHDGRFPEDYDNVLALPGIGPSTAGAILAQVLGQRHAILDGNVKRVLARYHMVEGWPGQSAVHKQLWQLAETHTPLEQVADYTQAIMDLGATLCTRSRPACDACPVHTDCRAFHAGSVAAFPGKKPKKALPVRQTRLLLIRNPQGEYLLEKRPPSGIWGGLWSLPELAMEQPVVDSVRQNWQLKVSHYSDRPAFRHTFSHFHLDITPCLVACTSDTVSAQTVVDDSDRFQWHGDLSTLGLAAPVSKVLKLHG
ncbi:MAG TPA: adenine DNA glycosylase [Gammaproteobacteria bacterium]|nr:adenine DNA glycosylase [Gammaproteobacteria bacterium]